METDGKALAAPANRKAASKIMQVAESRLEPWEHAFCELMAQRDKPLPKSKQAEAATLLAGFPVSAKEVEDLRHRRAYRRLLYELKAKRQEVLDEDKSIFLEAAPDAARLQAKAVRHLLEAKEVDVRAVPAITQPFVDRFWEKKQHVETKQTVVTINLTMKQAEALDEEPIDVEYEELSSEQVP